MRNCIFEGWKRDPMYSNVFQCIPMHSNVKSLRQSNCLKCLIWTHFGQPFVLQATPSSTDLPTLWHSVACRSLCPAPLPYLWRTATLRRSRTLRSRVNQSRVKLFGATLQLTWEPMTSHGAFMKHLASLSHCFHYYLLRSSRRMSSPLCSWCTWCSW